MARITVNTNKRHNLTNAIALPILIATDLTAVNVPENIEINGDVILNGNLSINGDVEISGKLKVGSVETGDIETKSGISKGKVSYIHP